VVSGASGEAAAFMGASGEAAVSAAVSRKSYCIYGHLWRSFSMRWICFASSFSRRWLEKWRFYCPK